jgi:predicted amidohydrolase YtcJ
MPENLERYARLEVLGHAVAALEGSPAGTRLSTSELNEIVNGDELRRLRPLEDPAPGLFVDSVSAPWGEALIFPGMVEDVAHVQFHLLKALAMAGPDGLGTDLYNRCYETMVPALAAVLAAGCAETAPEADLVLTGGEILTVDSARPRAEALAAAGDTVVALGDEEEVEPYVGDATRVIDLEGKLAVPGFVESHGHFMGTGQAQRRIDLLGTRSWDRVVALVDSAVAASEPGEWILGRGWHQEKWDEQPARTVQGFPVRDRLDEVAPDNPVYLTHASGHAGIANAAALSAAGVGPDTESPEGGEIVRDRRGRATGVLVDEAEGLVQEAVEATREALTAEQRRQLRVERARLADREALRHGVTSFHDQGGSLGTIALYRRLAEAGELGVRLVAMVAQDEFTEENRDTLRAVFTEWAGGRHLTVRQVGEVTADGALGSRSAWMLEPYADRPGNTGLNVTSMERIREIARIALEEGYQVAVHAIGDRANRETLDLYASLWDSAGVDGDTLRWRIEHAQHLHPDDVPRFGEMGVIASMQAIHACSDAPYNLQRLGERRVRQGAYVWRDLIDSGALVTNGTDAPVEDVDPLASLHCSVTRHVSGEPADSVFFPEQAMTRREALRTYTLNGARSAFQEDDLGSLAPGKLADVVVLSRNVMEGPADSIRAAEVTHTIVGGDVVWERGEGFSGLPEVEAPPPGAEGGGE